MAFNINQKQGKKRRIVSDINITPFVDVLLVLLIIFMVAAPMMTSSIDINLPQGTNNATSSKTQPITVSVKSDGSIYLQEESIKLAVLSQKIIELSNNNFSTKIQVRADKNLNYGRVMEIIKTLSIAGFDQVVLVTEMAQ